MARYARDRRPHVRPVEKIQLSEDGLPRRAIAAGLLLLLGGAALGWALMQLLAPETGWQIVEARTSDGPTCGEEFTLLYELGADGRSASAEGRALTGLYSQACRKAYQMFHTEERFEETVSLREICQRPNEVLEVDPALYRAFQAVQEAGDRTVYLGPVYARYDDLFTCQDDAQLVDFDPRISEAVRQEYAQLAAFARDPEAVDLELLGEGRVRLRVSEEYLRHAQADGIDHFLDFGWMKNAFIADYLADTLTQAGYTCGTLSSQDGFARCLDGREGSYSLPLLDWLEDRPIQAGTLEYQGPMSLVSLRSFPAAQGDEWRYYRLKSGEVRTLYLDPYDGGSCKPDPGSWGSVVCYSPARSCAELAMGVGQAYISGFSGDDWSKGLGSGEVRTITCWSDTREFVCTSRETVVTGLYENEDGVRYTLKIGPVPD